MLTPYNICGSCEDHVSRIFLRQETCVPVGGYVEIHLLEVVFLGKYYDHTCSFL